MQGQLIDLMRVEKNRGRSLFSGEIARFTEVGLRARRTKSAASFAWKDQLLKISNSGLVEAAGVELFHRL
jgi:ferric-dicitrate binding protein FerR (iron transport regulator)